MSLPTHQEAYITDLHDGHAVWVRIVFDHEDAMLAVFTMGMGELIAKASFQDCAETGAVRDLQDKIRYHVGALLRMACMKFVTVQGEKVPW